MFSKSSSTIFHRFFLIIAVAVFKQGFDFFFSFGGWGLDGALQLHYENLTMNNRAKLSTAAKLSNVKKKNFLKILKIHFAILTFHEII